MAWAQTLLAAREQGAGRRRHQPIAPGRPVSGELAGAAY
jgi:hypothetical protein